MPSPCLPRRRRYNHAVELKHKREAAIAAADKQLKTQMARTGNSRSARLAGVAASGNLYRLAQEQRQKREAVLAKADEDVSSGGFVSVQRAPDSNCWFGGCLWPFRPGDAPSRR